MNKKFSVVIALLLVFALAMPTSAAVFTDVQEDHWAYEAVNQLVAAGVIEGYPDGTFKGGEKMSRFEVAQAVNRALERVAEERELLEAELDSMKEGFTEPQKVELEDIVKSIVEKNMPEEETEVEGLNEKEYEQIANLIEALTFQYKAEIQSLGGRIDDVHDLIDSNQEEIEERIAALETDMNKVTFSGEYSVDYTDTSITGTGTPYFDPYVGTDYNADYDGAGYDSYDTVNEFYHSVTLDTAIKHGPLSASFSMDAVKDIFDGGYDDTNVVLNSLSGHITGNDLDLWIDEAQSLTMRPYLFDADNDVNGVIVDAFGNDYVMHNDVSTVLAGTESLDLFGQTFDFVVGLEGDSNKVAGVRTTMELAGFEVSPEFAVSDKQLKETYMTVNATGDLGPVATTYNMNLIDSTFTPIEASVTPIKGHDLLGEMSVGIVDFDAYYQAYNDGGSGAFGNHYAALEAEIVEENAINFAGFDVTADAAYNSLFNFTDASRMAFNTTAKNVMNDKLTLTGKFNYAAVGSNFVSNYQNLEVVDSTAFDAAADTLSTTGRVDYTVNDAISTSAEMVYDLDGSSLSQTYTADYVKGIYSAGWESVIAGSSTHTLTASVDPEAYNVMEVNLDPYASFKYEMASSNSMNYVFGLDADKALNEYATMTAGFEYADKDMVGDNGVTGTKVAYDLGVDYEISEDVTANGGYEVLNFTGDSSADDYKVRRATAGVSVSF